MGGHFPFPVLVMKRAFERLPQTVLPLVYHLRVEPDLVKCSFV